MVLLRRLLQLGNPIQGIIDFLYILQLVEYYNSLYLEFASQFFLYRKLQRREKLIYTSRIKITLILTAVLLVVLLIGIGLTGILINFLLAGVLLILVLLIIPVLVGVANLLATPLFNWQKRRVMRSTRAWLVKHNPGLKIIGVTGSFGKTSTKESINELLKYQYRTQLIDGNINTPLGIAQWIRQYLQAGTQILIVEMDADWKGKLAECVALVPPEVLVITNIADQHLTRLGGRDNLIKAHIEAIRGSKLGAKIIMPTSTKKLVESIDPQSLNARDAETVDDTAEFDINTNYQLAKLVAKHYQISSTQIKHALEEKTEVSRRRHLTQMHGFEIIDDSYNISLPTAISALDYAVTLAKKQSRELIVITGGIPELGYEIADGNHQYAKMINERASSIILLQTTLADELRSEIDSEKLMEATSMINAWEMIGEEFDSQSVLVLMQPELNDLYYVSDL